LSRLRLGAAIAALLLFSNAAQAADAWARNDLEKLLVAGANDPAQRTSFMQAILTGQLCALTDQKVPDDLTRADPNVGFKILGVQAPDGQPATPVFTAPDRVTEAFPDKFPLCLQGAILLSKMRGQRVVLDPGQPYGVLWSPDELDHLLGVERIASLANVQLTTPDKPPAALVARLKEALGAIVEVKAAWLALAYWPEQKEWAWFLEVHTDAQHQQLEALIDAATARVDMEDKPMDISILPPDAPPGKGIELLSPRTP
jgi:hypothetical protein